MLQVLLLIRTWGHWGMNKRVLLAGLFALDAVICLLIEYTIS